MNFIDKTVIVTGGGTGIGKETALLFAERGARVLIAGRREEKLLQTAGEARDRGLDIAHITCDVSKEDECRESVNFAMEQFGNIDILFNNAGVLYRGLTHKISTEDWEKTFDTNARGTWLMCKHAIPHMLERRRGWIVNNSSLIGLKGFPGLSAYTASKGAVIQLTRSMALEYADKGIRVNAVCPGAVIAPMVTEGYLRWVDDEEEGLRFLKSFHPMGRLGTTSEIAHAVLFLCDENVGFMTGNMLPVDGGWNAR